jgi:hypothetical protein
VSHTPETGGILRRARQAGVASIPSVARHTVKSLPSTTRSFRSTNNEDRESFYSKRKTTERLYASVDMYTMQCTIEQPRAFAGWVNYVYPILACG